MQWATALHACPRPGTWQLPQPVMPGCDGHMAQTIDATGQLSQCKAHCEQARQVVNSAPAADFDTTPVMLAVVDWSLAARATPPDLQVEPVVRPGAAPPGSPPLYLSLQVLRN